MAANIIFFGTPEFAVPTLASLHADSRFDVTAVVTQPDRRQGRGKKLHVPPVKAKALELGIPVFQPEYIRKSTSEFLNSLQNIAPFSLGVVVAFGQILPTRVLDLPKFGCLNIHGSLLPRWRGAAPMQRAIMAGDSYTGVCIMQMEAGLDTGPVFSRRKIRITDQTTLALLHDTLALKGAELLLETIPQILSGTLTAEPQGNDGATHAKKITPEECKIDWSQDARTICRMIHGISPFPGAYSFLNEKRVKIFKCRAIQADSDLGNAGEIICCDKDKLDVQCGNGLLEVHTAQVEGKRKMKIADFLRGVDIAVGDRFN